ncbi:tetratricopeptide repeat protein [Planomonospora alba]|uniref:tetratricopeptide repeat protein n=1 Tax=Planomonospora alba TaxID=161354 RepID=UPI0031ECD8C6
MPGTPMEDLLRDPRADEVLRACAPGLSPRENRARIAEIAAAEGLGPRWGAAWRAGSRDAHRLAALAYERGGSALQDAVVEGVLRAYFIDALDISDPRVLERAADGAGFPGAAEALAGGAEEVERFRHAESLLDRRDPLGALTLLRPLLDEHGEDRGIRLLAARAYYASAQLGRAAAALEPLVAEAPDDSYARHLLGRTLQRQGKAEAAAPHLAIAAAMSPEYAG